MQKATSVDSYVAGAPPALRSKLKEIRRAILKAAPKAIEKIGYGMPSYVYKGRLAYFGYFKDHLSLFAMPPIPPEFKKKLTVTGKATIQFALDEKIPAALITKLIGLRVKKNESKAKVSGLKNNRVNAMSHASQNKTQPTKVLVKDFLASIKNEQQRKDGEQLVRLMKKVTGKPAVMWGPSIIGFDKYHYKYESGREGDMVMAGFSPRASNLTIYLVGGTSKYAKLLSKLGPHTTGKVCVYIKRLNDINMAVLEEVIRTSYEYAVAHKNDMSRAE